MIANPGPLRKTDPHFGSKRLQRKRTVQGSTHDSASQCNFSVDMENYNSQKKHFRDDTSKIIKLITQVDNIDDRDKRAGKQTFKEKYQTTLNTSVQSSAQSIKIVHTNAPFRGNLVEMIEQRTKTLKCGKLKDQDRMDKSVKSWRVMGRQDENNPQIAKRGKVLQTNENDGNPITGEGYKDIQKFARKRFDLNQEGLPILKDIDQNRLQSKLNKIRRL